MQDSSLADAIVANVSAALAEDVGAGDLSGGLIPADRTARAHVVSRQAGVFCGRAWVEETLAQLGGDAAVEWRIEDGDAYCSGQVLFVLSGPARVLLTAERTLLNFVQLLSGTATATRAYVERLAGSGVTLLDTRKTVPGLRQAQKYAVRCGGGRNHRMGLYDAFLIKENHIAAAGSIAAAVAHARQMEPPTKPVEVEVENLAQLDEAIAAGANTVLLDNFGDADLRRAVELAGGRVKLEASGNITRENIVTVAAAGVDYISVGDLTKRVEPIDLSMRFID